MKKFLTDAKGHLMSGISYMLPLIIGSGLTMAIPMIIGMSMGITQLTADLEGFPHYLYLIYSVGQTGLGLINTVLAAFVAYSIADKAAIGAGFIGGALATNTNAGFLGACVAGFVAGYAVRWAKNKIHLPEVAQSLLPTIILPLIGTGAVAIVMGIVLAGPLAWLNTALTAWIRDMCASGTNRLVVSAVLGAMMAFDLGGPVNKSALMAAIALMAEGIYTPMVYVSAGIIIPPLGYALATTIQRKRFSKQWQEVGMTTWAMAIIGLTEGAIPFTLFKASRLIPVNVLAGAIGAGVVGLLGSDAVVPPAGGLFAFLTISNPLGYYAGLIVGGLVIAALAPIVVNFIDGQDESELVTEDDIDISFE